MLGSGESAHWLLDRNQLALTARLALADEAAVSLDVQYFVWQSDASGHLLADRILHAADRGVRVRILVDDFGVAGRGGDVLKLDAHPGVEVRSFNPWVTRGNRFGTAVEFLVRAHELNRRMHNKTFIADGRFAVLGGRNIGDRYFGLYEPFVQNDLDVMVAGPMARDVAATFDEYWNSEHAFPVILLPRDPRPQNPVAVTQQELHESIAAERREAQRRSRSSRSDWSGVSGRARRDIRAGAQRDLVGVARHPERGAPAALRRLQGSRRERALGSLDQLAVFHSRRRISRAAARARREGRARRGRHELARDEQPRRRAHRAIAVGGARFSRPASSSTSCAPMPRRCRRTLRRQRQSSRLGLHTKAVVVDGERAFVGSPNVDPRSMVLNTEIGVVGDGPEFTARVAALIERDISPANAWRVTMDEEGWLRWANCRRGRAAATGQGLRSARDRVPAEPSAAQVPSVSAA